MATQILVTGATGTVGSNVVRQLASAKEVVVRAAGHGSNRELANAPSNVTWVELDYDRNQTLRPALEGVQKVFLLNPLVPNLAEQTRRLVAAAKEAGVEQIVKQSGMGASTTGPIMLARWHGESEQIVRESGLAWTMVRPNNFMQNFLSYYPPDSNGDIFLPWGDGAVSFIDARDVAEVVAKVLTTEGHGGQIYEITGPEALNGVRVATIISEVSDRPVRYLDVLESAAATGMAGAGMPEVLVKAMMELHAVCKAGYSAGVTGTFEAVMGRAPRRFRQFAAEHAAAWKKRRQT